LANPRFAFDLGEDIIRELFSADNRFACSKKFWTLVAVAHLILELRLLYTCMFRSGNRLRPLMMRRGLFNIVEVFFEYWSFVDDGDFKR
jgi:hypothetical protein